MHTRCAHSARLWLASLLFCGKIAHFSFAVRMSTIAERGSRLREYDSDSQMRLLLPFQIQARPQRGMKLRHLSALAMRQIAVICHARKHRTGTAQPTCSLSPAEQPARMHDVAFMRTPSIAIRTAVVYVRYVAAQFYRLDRQLRADLSPHCIEGA